MEKSAIAQCWRFFHFFENFRFFPLHFAMTNNSFITKTSQIKTMKKKLKTMKKLLLPLGNVAKNFT